MTTLTLQVDKNTKEGKVFLDLVAVLSKDNNAVRVIKEEESHYPIEFVNMVKEASKESYKEVKSETLWEDLGL